MFGLRSILIESAFFSTYRYQKYDFTTFQVSTKIIDPLIPPEYRLVAYLTPGLISLLFNSFRLYSTTKGLAGYLMKYPQFIIACCFSPFMFEGYKPNNKQDEYKLRIWKSGTFINALCIGCVPQLILIITDLYRGVHEWDFISSKLSDEQWVLATNDAYINHKFGNIIFAITTSIFNFLLILVFFYTTSLFSDRGIHCQCHNILFCPCPGPCISESEPELITLTLDNLSNIENENEPVNSFEGAAVCEHHQTSPSRTKIFLYSNQTRNKLWLAGKEVSTQEIIVLQVCFYF